MQRFGNIRTITQVNLITRRRENEWALKNASSYPIESRAFALRLNRFWEETRNQSFESKVLFSSKCTPCTFQWVCWNMVLSNSPESFGHSFSTMICFLFSFCRYVEISWWLDGVLQTVIGTLGVLINILALPILFSKRMKSVFNCLLTILLVMETFFILSTCFETFRWVVFLVPLLRLRLQMYLVGQNYFIKYHLILSSEDEKKLESTVFFVLKAFLCYRMKKIGEFMNPFEYVLGMSS